MIAIRAVHRAQDNSLVYSNALWGQCNKLATPSVRVPHPVFLETLRISDSDESSLILLPSQLDPSKVVIISTFVVNDTAVRC
jgi:hypothetical protein